MPHVSLQFFLLTSVTFTIRMVAKWHQRAASVYKVVSFKSNNASIITAGGRKDKKAT